jgi:hypothetical protein
MTAYHKISEHTHNRPPLKAQNGNIRAQATDTSDSVLTLKAVERLRKLLNPFRLAVRGGYDLYKGCKDHEMHLFEISCSNQLRELPKRKLRQGSRITEMRLEVLVKYKMQAYLAHKKMPTPLGPP